MPTRTGLRWLAALTLLAAGAGCSTGDGERGTGPAGAHCEPVPAAALQPAAGAWFGVSIDWSADLLAAYADRLGRAPAVAVTFAGIPLSEADRSNVAAAVEQARGTGSMLLLTLEPRAGLGSVTTSGTSSTATTAPGCRSSCASPTR